MLVVVVALWGYMRLTEKVPCEEPIYYSIGVLDNRFNMGREDLKKSLLIAEGIWEKTLDKNLFDYKDGASLKINLIYDSRQQMADKNRVLESQVKETKQSADSIKQEFLSLQNNYKTASTEYQSYLSEFKSLQQKYNEEVLYWNKKGGAPKNEYEKIAREKDNLSSMQITLETKRLEVNGLADQVNDLIKKYNYLVKDVNSTINVINQSADKEFEEGEYVSDKNGEKINIYEFNDRSILNRVLAHELGHAIGLFHNNNSNSIMYYLNNSKNIIPTGEDIKALKIICQMK